MSASPYSSSAAAGTFLATKARRLCAIGIVPLFHHALGYAARHPLRAAHALATDPAAVLDTIVDRFVKSRENRAGPCRYDISHGWEAKLHRVLGADWPCSEAQEFDGLWRSVIEKLQHDGLRVGPESFNGFNDGDTALVRAIWCIIRHRKPERVVETTFFVHDSFHTERNVSFEIECAWRHLAPGGAMVIDDLDTNWAFRSFVGSNPVYRSFVCESEPVRPTCAGSTAGVSSASL